MTVPRAGAPPAKPRRERSAPSTGPVPALERLTGVLEDGGARLSALRAATERRLGEVAAGGGEALGPYAAATLGAGGKRLRPLLVFLCAGGEGGEELVRAGAAVELVHMATLVHDDVVDRATLRRGSPTVFVEAGRDTAIATGDLLFARAFAELVPTGSADGVRALSSACSGLARGELMQREDAWSPRVTVERYLERCALKTARLFEAACRLGALLGASGTGDGVESLAAFGTRIGLAFQVFDDVLDVSGRAEDTGKHRGTDLLDGTVTLPLILARERDAALRAVDIRREVTSASDAEALCDRVAATGALEAGRRCALDFVADARRALDGAPLPTGHRRALDLVAEGVVARYA